MSNIKWCLIIALLCCAIAISGTAYAVTGNKVLNAEYADVTIFIDGKQLVPRNVNGEYVEPYIVDGTTYVPIRAISEAFECDVRWDYEDKKVRIYTPSMSYQEIIEKYDQTIIFNQYTHRYGDNIQYTEVDLDGDGVDELLIYDAVIEVAQIYTIQ